MNILAAIRRSKKIGILKKPDRTTLLFNAEEKKSRENDLESKAAITSLA